jgi:uncharacterized membrane protein YeaQ/YmgE (transglycosylase-associated protein family)
MSAADALVTSQLMHQAYRIGETAAVATLAGWIAERTLDTGLRFPGIAPLAGLAGLYVGPVVWSLGGWNTGPRIADFPILPAIAGALGVCAVLKLVGLGFAGSRR